MQREDRKKREGQKILMRGGSIVERIRAAE